MRKLTLAGLLVLISAAVMADDLEQQVRTTMEKRLEVQHRMLSLGDCIRIALEHNLDVQISRMDPEIAGFSLKSAYAGYDPTFSLSGRHNYELSPGGLDEQSRAYTGTESEIDSFNGSLGGLLPWGTRYTFGATVSDRSGNSPGAVIDPGNSFITTNAIYDINTGLPSGYLYSTNYGTLPTRNPFENAAANVGFFELRQPLLKDFWVDGTRLQIFLNRKNLQRSEVQLRSQIIQTITAVEEAYYNFIYSEETVKVQEKALELAQRLVAENRRRVEVGALAPLDERQAESEAASRQADLLEARSNRGTQQRALKNLLSDDYAAWLTTEIHPTDTLRAVPQPLSLQDSWRRGMADRPDLQQARIDVQMQEKRVVYADNQRYPQLDLVGDIGYAGSARNTGQAFKQVRNLDNTYYAYGAQLTIPLGNIGARNNYKAARTTRDQLELVLKQLEQNAMIEIENAIAVARSSLERVDATRQARAYAEEALRAEEMKLEKGKSTSFVVLDLQSKLTAARSAEIRALADYNIALARLARFEGSTLERHGVELKLR
ncbi:MAG TPA: TolC family protein [Verrucomicrobiota bacterium]|nr:TolC family protein [Verrucomicrobiota bacterium]HNT13378.1 TolC family protein [Verrucomicrobiota bacterium]